MGEENIRLRSAEGEGGAEEKGSPAEMRLADKDTNAEQYPTLP